MENCGSFKVYVASSHDVNKNSKVSEKKNNKISLFIFVRF